MSEHASIRCYGERDDRKGAARQRASWYQWLLAWMTVAFTVCSPLPGEALNGEPVGGEGLFRTGACAKDFTISCDDLPASGVVSCHMRGTKGDEGLAINACVDGRITVGAAQSQFLEQDVTISASDFGEFVCGKDSDGKNFCIVCDTFNDPEADPGDDGRSNCVKITNKTATNPTSPACGAYTVSIGTPAACSAQTQALKQFFSAPSVGFSISFNASDAGVPGAKSLVLCGTRSWQCIDNRPVSPNPLVTGATQVQQQQSHELIQTPCCIKLASGANYCSTKLTSCIR